MSTLYLFPCQCGHKTPVAVNDAGKSLDCESCGQRLEIPGMREIRKLEPVTESVETSRPKKNWSFEKGLYFSFGLGAALIGLIVAAACFYTAYYTYPNVDLDIRGEWKQTADSVPPRKSGVWGYAPEPLPGTPQYEPVAFNPDDQVWEFVAEPNRQPVPREYFSKWGYSYAVSIESQVNRSSVEELWKFWFETEPGEPLPEWQVPLTVINRRFSTTFYGFAIAGSVLALVGIVMVSIAIFKKS